MTIINLASLSPTQGFVLRGEAGGDWAGFSVSGAGDVNGDGIDDVIIGAPFGDEGGSAAGQAYVVYGQAGTARGLLDLRLLSSSQGFVIRGDAEFDNAGYGVSSAGDVNGDGTCDLIVGARGGSDGGTGAGEAYVIYGVTGVRTNLLDLRFLNSAQGFVIQGDAAGDNAGESVSSAGDVNGDGIDDLILGARGGDDGGAQAGEAYVIYGVAGARPGRLDLTALTAAQGFVIQGDRASDFAGSSVSAAGDVNGDGIGDLIVGALGGDDGGPEAGEAYVIYGVAGARPGRLDLTALTAAQGFVIQGDATFDLAGLSVSSAGDVNGDGIDDLIVGAPWGNDGGTSAGEAYVIYGVAGARPGRLDLTTLTAAQGFVIQGDLDRDQAGYSVSDAGDVNGDGIDDMIIGARGDNNNVTGSAYVIYGVAGARPGRLDLTDLADSEGFVIRGVAANDNAGSSVSSAGDVNGDGFDDLIVGAPYNDNRGFAAGEAYVIYGFASGVTRTGGPLADTLTGGAGNDTLFGGGGDDRLEGLNGNDRLDGDLGHDRLTGGAGDDTMRGGAGNDVYAIDARGDRVFETTTIGSRIDAGGVDTVQSTISFSLNATAGVRFVERLTLTGSAGINGTGNALANILTGNAANNVLNGLLGSDTMRGGAGSDTFVFSTAPGSANVDQISDFNVVDDIIRLDDRAFAGLSVGALGAAAFAAVPTGATVGALVRIIYETDSGRLFFDADGNGAGARVHFATVTANLALTSADFFVV